MIRRILFGQAVAFGQAAIFGVVALIGVAMLIWHLRGLEGKPHAPSAVSVESERP